MSKEFLKNQGNENQERKLFANKKANIALLVIGGVIVVGIIAAAIFALV